jgi:hypothetical protein
MQGQKRWRLSFVAAAAVLTGAAPGVTLMDATADEGHFYLRLPNGQRTCVGAVNDHLQLDDSWCVVWRHVPQAIPGPYVNWP